MQVLDRFTQVLFDDYYKKDNLTFAAFSARTIVALNIILVIVALYHVLDILGVLHFSEIAPGYSRDLVLVVFLFGIRISVELLTKNNFQLLEGVSKDKGKLWHRDLNLMHGVLLIGMLIHVVLGTS